MIPILYEKNETAFVSNGLGRLRDCISAVVTEERNGIYELDFEYPVDGLNYSKIQCGRIVAVRHDESGDVQPFDIVGYSRPINGVVTFHCVHISYRQTALTVWGNNINSLADAFTLLGTSTPTNQFTYWTDKTSTGFLASADKVPHSVRQMLGGMEGSILDTYGGEYEWDKWTVKLWQSRGEQKNFTIRYGLNLADYKEDLDYSESFNSVIPYWTGQNKKGNDIVVRGSEVSSGQPSFNGTSRCVPLDLTDKFETKPSVADLEAEASSQLSSQQPYLPSQTIEVDFVRLYDSADYAQFAVLQKCRLCDSIKVVFSRYNMSGIFKIVKTEYNVLQERYNKLELGTLAATLSEAMGISQGSPASSFSSDLIGLSDFMIKTHTFSYSAISSGSGSGSKTATFSETGYFPLGVVGFRTGNSAAVPTRFNLTSRTSGQAELTYVLRAVAAVSAGSGDVDILWVKEE